MLGLPVENAGSVSATNHIVISSRTDIFIKKRMQQVVCISFRTLGIYVFTDLQEPIQRCTLTPSLYATVDF